MKKFTLLFLLVSAVAFGQQTVRGLIKDAVSGEAIFSASVAAKNTSVGTITNEEGMFQLTIPKANEIQVSCVGFKTKVIPVSGFGSEIKTITLEQDEEMLEEVVVSNTPIQELLKDLIRTSQVRFNKPIVLNAYYREFVKMDGKHTKFSDGLLDYHISGSAKKTKSELVVKQSRAVQIKSEEEEEEANELDLNSLLNVQKGISNNYEFTFSSAKLIESKNYLDYEWQLKSKKDASGKEMMVIYFEPKAEVQKSLYKGAITYDPATRLIYDLDMQLAPSHMPYIKEMNLLIIRISILDSRLKVAYKMVGNNYMMSYNNRYAKLKIRNKKRFNNVIESRSDLLVTDFSAESGFNKKDVYKEKNLYSRGSKYSEKFWKQNNSIVLTSEEEKIISSLEKTSSTQN